MPAACDSAGGPKRETTCQVMLGTGTAARAAAVWRTTRHAAQFGEPSWWTECAAATLRNAKSATTRTVATECRHAGDRELGRVTRRYSSSASKVGAMVNVTSGDAA